MNTNQWKIFCAFRESYKSKIKEWKDKNPELLQILKTSEFDNTPPYPIENAIVYNKALDEITCNDDIKLIVIGDNPGKDEQLDKNQKYLVGQAGKIAAGFFRRNPELEIDFRKNVIILNKTPIHTPKTLHLKKIASNPKIKELIEESQKWMAEQTAALHIALFENAEKGEKPELWLVGYSELKGKGIFLPYRNYLIDAYYEKNSEKKLVSAWENVFVFQHFSMNRFLVDLKTAESELPLAKKIETLGKKHKAEIFFLA